MPPKIPTTINADMMKAIANELRTIAKECDYAADLLGKTNKTIVVNGFAMTEKGMKQARTLAKSVIGEASVGGDVTEILRKVAEKQVEYRAGKSSRKASSGEKATQ